MLSVPCLPLPCFKPWFLNKGAELVFCPYLIKMWKHDMCNVIIKKHFFVLCIHFLKTLQANPEIIKPSPALHKVFYA